MNPLVEQIRPETIQKLVALAAANGFRSIDDFVEQGLPEPVGAGVQERPLYETATPEELAQAFVEWAESHGKNGPALTHEDVSRESIYEDRW